MPYSTYESDIMRVLSETKEQNIDHIKSKLASVWYYPEHAKALESLITSGDVVRVTRGRAWYKKVPTFLKEDRVKEYNERGEKYNSPVTKARFYDLLVDCFDGDVKKARSHILKVPYAKPSKTIKYLSIAHLLSCV